jgi:phytoene synthase
MDADRLHRALIRGGSRTYYNASLLFPKAVRRDVFTLYAFVRVADNLVDDQPVHPEEFLAFRSRWRAAQDGTPAGDAVIDPFVELSRRKGFDPRWTEDFLGVMEGDLDGRPCENLADVLRYTWGSAEVIGLFMVRVLGLPDDAKPSACLLGRSLQFINFLRDVAEDHSMGRRYLPLEGALPDLSPQTAHDNPEAFRSFLRGWAAVCRQWQEGGRRGYHYLPWRCRLAVKTASDLYNWTAGQIEKEPMDVWKHKIKPSRVRFLATALGNLISLPFRGKEDKA